ncbi:aldehyde dehydrogenase family protein [Armatimonas rosea]|uniref:Glyceraldehyde-3-phosphate dehydrogenase (NADP+) n=1 Tax=Armatimonas rosea TaxID=685828 RepID=A0A7W9W4P5_ARMRO|nr:aldehyde dehydrogenase family protein [Armatimonas rosea]MBB6049624.1 glyceraldehyde-3-phosphate dehydrogenase (NADP+) [Armatimonas rosea]
MKFTTLAEADAALTAAVACFDQTRKLSSAERHAILTAISAGLQDQREAFAQLLCAEAKKPIRDARVEVDRAALTFSLAADEARRFGGELLPLDLSAAAVGRMGLVRRFPLGPIAAVTPFNFPLNLVAHKVAPAIAVGAPVVLKPAEKTPQTALKLQELVHACGWPEAAFAVLTPETPQEIGHLLADDPRLPVFSFTGSDTVGWALKQRATKKRVILELGGNAAVLVDHASKVEHAVGRCVVGGFAYSGQVCISVQRIFVVENYFEAFCADLVARVRALKLGDPADETTDLGPMITEDAAIRVEQWVEQAKAAGARVLLQGPRDGALLAPSILTAVPTDQPLVRDEVFGPVVIVEPVASFDEGIARINASRFGLQAGVFTYDMRRVLQAHQELEVGGVIINDVPTFRSDAMPYGGEGDSGVGREGIRWTMDEYTSPRVLVLSA